MNDDEKLVAATVKSENQLIAIYKDAYIMLLEKMQYNNLRNIDNRHLKALVQDVTKILKILSKDTQSWIDEHIPKIYDVGVQVAHNHISKLDMAGDFTKLNRSAIEILSSDMFNDLAMSINNVGRSLSTEIRRIALQSVQKRLILGQSMSATTKDMYDDMVKNGLTALRDRQGKRWDLMTYSSMVIRTKTRDVVTRGTVNTMIAAGDKYKDPLLFDLVQVSEHRGSCPICLPYQGKVYSLSGGSDGYPKLPKFTPFHPNCRHVLTPFFERLYKGDIDDLKEFSNGKGDAGEVDE